jgi:hypothetical protein
MQVNFATKSTLELLASPQLLMAALFRRQSPKLLGFRSASLVRIRARWIQVRDTLVLFGCEKQHLLVLRTDGTPRQM